MLRPLFLLVEMLSFRYGHLICTFSLARKKVLSNKSFLRMYFLSREKEGALLQKPLADVLSRSRESTKERPGRQTFPRRLPPRTPVSLRYGTELLTSCAQASQGRLHSCFQPGGQVRRSLPVSHRRRMTSYPCAGGISGEKVHIARSGLSFCQDL